jgi:hypothetical protein
MGADEKNDTRFFARPDHATNLPSDDTVLIAYPPCPSCKSTGDFAAVYEERRWTTYPSVGITLDGVFAEKEDEPNDADEAEFIPLRRKSDGLLVITCESCLNHFVPVVADENTVVLESVDEADTTFAYDPPEAG